MFVLFLLVLFVFSSFLPYKQEWFCFFPFSGYSFLFFLPLALYGTIVFVVLKDFTGHHKLFYNISSVSFKQNSACSPPRTFLVLCLVHRRHSSGMDNTDLKSNSS